MEHVNLLYKDFQRFFTMLPNEKYVIYIPPSNHWFLFKTFQHFFLKICHEKNSIRRRKLCSYCGSTFLFESLFIKFKYVILQDYFRKFCQISLEICLLSLVSKNLRRHTRPSPCDILG